MVNVVTTSEAIFTNYMGNGSSTSSVPFYNTAAITNPNSTLKAQRLGTQLLFLTALYPNASSATVRNNILQRIHRILKSESNINLYLTSVHTGGPTGYAGADPSGMLGPLGIYSAYALAKAGNFDYKQASGLPTITRTYLLNRLKTFLSAWNGGAQRIGTSQTYSSYFETASSHGRTINLSGNRLYGTKHAPFALNGIISNLGSQMFLEAAINGKTSNPIYNRCNTIANAIPNALRNYYGNTRTYNGRTELLLPIGAAQYKDVNSTSSIAQIRGYFPSIGYNSLVVMGLSLMARAQAMSTSVAGTAPQLRHVQPSGILKTLANEIVNYHSTRIKEDGRGCELGRPNFLGGSAGEYSGTTALKGSGTLYNDAQKWYVSGSSLSITTSTGNPGVQSVDSGGFLGLAEIDRVKPASATAYGYTFAWNGPHSIIQNDIGAAIKNLHSLSDPITFLCSNSYASQPKAEAAAHRILQGLAGCMITGQTTIN